MCCALALFNSRRFGPGHRSSARLAPSLSMEATLQYFRQAEKILEANDFEDEEAQQLFIQNVFSEAEGLEYRLSCSHDGSVILEKMVRHGTGFHLRVFFEKIRERLLDMCCHRYASHVVETWLRMAVSRMAAPEEQDA